MQAYISLHAVNDDRNINRFYTIHINETLFDEYALIINNGRRGTKGRQRISYYTDNQLLLNQLVHILKRRFSAMGRLGTNYKVIHQSFDDEFNQCIFESLPLKVRNSLLN